MAKRYRIDLMLNAAQLNGAAAQANGHLNGIAKTAQKAAKAAQQADDDTLKKKKLTTDQIEAIETRWRARDYRDRVALEAKKARLDQQATARRQREADKQTADSQRAADREARDKQRSLDKQIRDAQRTADKLQRDKDQDAAKMAEIETRWLAREYRDRVAFNARKERSNAKLLSDEEVRQRVHNERVKRHNQARVDAALYASGVEKRSFEFAGMAAERFTDQLKTAAAQAVGLNAIWRAVSAIGDGFATAHRMGMEMTKDLAQVTDDLRAIANLRDKFAPDDAVLAQYVDLRKASGLKHSEATAFEEYFTGTPVVAPEKMSEAEQAKYKQGAAVFTARLGGSPEARGKLLGLLPTFVPGKNLKATDVLSVAQRNEDILKRGVGTNAQLTAQYQQVLTQLVSEDLKGIVRNPQQAAALTAIASVKDTERSSEMVIEAVRELRGFTKFRHLPGHPEMDSQAEFLKKAGINEHDDAKQAMLKLFTHFDRDAEGAKAGRAFDAYLGEHGFRNQTGNTQLRTFYEQYKAGVFGRVMAAAEAPLEPGKAEAMNRAFLASDTGQDRVGEAFKDAAKIERGKARRPLSHAMDRAEADLVAEGMDDLADQAIRNTVQGAFTGGKMSGRDVRIGARAIDRMQRETGIARPSQKLAEQMPGGMGFLFGEHWLGQSMRSLFGFNEADAALLNLAKELKNNTEEIRQRNKMIQQAGGRAVAPQALAGPRQPLAAGGIRP